MIDRRKKVLLLIPNLTFGGAQRVFHDHSLLLSQHYEVIECVFNLETSQAFPSGNQVLSLDVKAGTNFLDKFYRFLQRVRRLRQIKKQYNIDICISHLEGADLVNVLSRGEEKIVAWIHGSKRFDQNISGLLGFVRQRLLIPYIYSSVDKVACVSESIRQELIGHYQITPSHIATMYNFFDVEKIGTMSDQPLHDKYLSAFGNDAALLIFSGRLSKQKNIGELLRWYSTFHSKTKTKLLIVGDGELREELLNLCASLKIRFYHPWSNLVLDDSCQVYFLGYQENPHKFVSKAQIFLLPSLWEGFPMVLGEAMVCSAPIVSTDCPTGPREMLTGDLIEYQSEYPYFAKFGVLIPFDKDLRDSYWTTAVNKLLEDHKLIEYYRDQSRKRVDFFSKENISHRVFDLVNSILTISNSF